MPEWVERPLDDCLASVETGKRPVGGGESQSEGLPSIGGENISRDGRLDVGGVRRVPCSFARSLRAGRLRDGDVLLNKDGAQTGKVARYGGEFAEAYINEHVFSLRSNEEIDSRFLFYSLLDDRAQRQITARITGSAQPGLASSFVNYVRLRAPDLQYQERIATVIACVDEQIAHTEALTAKQEAVRAGMMADLFTRGLDEHGALRPPRPEAPELYHETALGWLPKGWEAEHLITLLAPVATPLRSGPFGSALLASELVEQGVPLLGIDNIFAERFEPVYHRFVSERKFGELSRYQVAAGDVVITIMGTVGRCCVVPDTEGSLMSSKHLWTMTFDKRKYIPDLIAWQLNYAPWVTRWFAAQSQGGIMSAIQSTTLKNTILPVPSIYEQERVHAIWAESSDLLDNMKDTVYKLCTLRTSLLQSLLSPSAPLDRLTEAAP